MGTDNPIGARWIPGEVTDIFTTALAARDKTPDQRLAIRAACL